MSAPSPALPLQIHQNNEGAPNLPAPVAAATNQTQSAPPGNDPEPVAAAATATLKQSPPDALASPPPAKRRRTSQAGTPPWNDMLYELLKFRAMHGHCLVPYKNGGALGKWVARQRWQAQRHSLKPKEDSIPEGVELPKEDSKPRADLGPQELNEERAEVLKSIGFVWDVVKADYDERWKKRFDELVDYVTVNGHCLVPQSTSLGKWVKLQREGKKETDLKMAGVLPARPKKRPCLSRERIEKLESIGFQWTVAKPPIGWERRYEQLVEYQQIHGDCNVPQSYPPDKPFGRWVMKQRCEHSLKLRGEKSQLTDEREARLNALGFSWVAPNFRKKTIAETEDPMHVALM